MSEEDEIFEFIKVAGDTAIERGKEYEFECPICKGKGIAIKNSYNGHLWAKCEECNMTIIE